jgi:predicted DNA-binding protein YlxM (UPF0122 family)
MLKRTEKLLYQYEEKLGFAKLLNAKNKKMRDILDKIIELENGLHNRSSSEQLLRQIDEIKHELDGIINN